MLKNKIFGRENKKKEIAGFLCVLSLLVVGTYFVMQYQQMSDEPEFFPLHDPSAKYTVTTGCPYAQGWQEKTSTSSVSSLGYCVMYKGEKNFDPENTHSHYFSITVGKSLQDLKPFLNKDIIITSGHFSNSTKQCIANTPCMSIGGPFSVIDLESLEYK